MMAATLTRVDEDILVTLRTSCLGDARTESLLLTSDVLTQHSSRSAQFERGRRVQRVYFGYRETYTVRALSGSYLVSEDLDANTAVVEISADVNVNDVIVVLSPNHPRYGEQVTVTSEMMRSDGWLNIGTGTVGLWAHVADDSVNAVGPAVARRSEWDELSDDEKQISDWWITRIKETARKAKKKNGWCNEIDTLVKQLLEPLLVKWTVSAADGGFAALDPAGDRRAWFVTESEAKTYINGKNKNLSVL